MPKWLKNPQWWIVALLAIIAANGSYNSYKLYQVEEAKKSIPAKRR